MQTVVSMEWIKTTFLENIAALSLVVVTFICRVQVVEVEGRWPWQEGQADAKYGGISK